MTERATFTETSEHINLTFHKTKTFRLNHCISGAESNKVADFTEIMAVPLTHSRDMPTGFFQVLRENGILTSEEDAEFVQKICGILDVNSFEVRGPPSESGETEKLRGIYLRAALMAHDCVANTHLAVGDDFEMSIHASVPIPLGHPIYFNYTSAMQVCF